MQILNKIPTYVHPAAFPGMEKWFLAWPLGALLFHGWWDLEVLFNLPPEKLWYTCGLQTQGASAATRGPAGRKHPPAEGPQAVHGSTTRTRVLHRRWGGWACSVISRCRFTPPTGIPLYTCMFQVTCTRAQWTGSCGGSALVTVWPSSRRWDRTYRNAVGVLFMFFSQDHENIRLLC